MDKIFILYTETNWGEDGVDYEGFVLTKDEAIKIVDERNQMIKNAKMKTSNPYWWNYVEIDKFDISKRDKEYI